MEMADEVDTVPVRVVMDDEQVQRVASEVADKLLESGKMVPCPRCNQRAAVATPSESVPAECRVSKN